MNQRIAELYKQAIETVDPLNEELVEKFALLIVRECASYLEEVEGYSFGLLDHFGVE